MHIDRTLGWGKGVVGVKGVKGPTWFFFVTWELLVTPLTFSELLFFIVSVNPKEGGEWELKSDHRSLKNCQVFRHGVNFITLKNSPPGGQDK